MRRAFVVQLGPETRTAEGEFEGWVEEVDTCTELRFHSTEELLKFLGQRFDMAIAPADKSQAADSELTSIRKKNSRNRKQD
jgi:hypothetical protein